MVARRPKGHRGRGVQWVLPARSSQESPAPSASIEPDAQGACGSSTNPIVLVSLVITGRPGMKTRRRHTRWEDPAPLPFLMTFPVSFERSETPPRARQRQSGQVRVRQTGASRPEFRGCKSLSHFTQRVTERGRASARRKRSRVVTEWVYLPRSGHSRKSRAARARQLLRPAEI